MNEYKIIEKMFEKLGITVDGKEIWEEIEKNVADLGIEGYHNIELRRYGENRDLIFVEVDVKRVYKNHYDKEDDLYFTDIMVLSIQDSKNTVYVEDIEF